MRGNNANCFLHRMANLLIFIHNGGIRKVITQSRLNNGTHFSCYECLPKEYNVQMSLFHSHMRFYVTQWSTTRLCGGLSVYSHLPPPLRKKCPQDCRSGILFLVLRTVDLSGATCMSGTSCKNSFSH